MRALIDLDIVVYRCGFAAEKTQYTIVDSEAGIPIAQFTNAKERDAFLKEKELTGYEVERERLVEPLSHALANVKSVMAGILESVKTDDYIGFLSGGKCFRNGIATILEYKANRKDAPKPVHYDEIRRYLRDNYNVHECGVIEADDALALCQTDDTVIVSIDKDLLQIPGRHYNWVDDKKIYISPEVGLVKQYMQVLSGDPTDNIPGIRGVGTITARKIMKDVEPTKKALSAACTAEWEAYFRSDRNTEFTPGPEGVWQYGGWDGVYYSKTAQEIAMEVYQLVTVGGMGARDALQDASEELPYARTA